MKFFKRKWLEEIKYWTKKTMVEENENYVEQSKNFKRQKIRKDAKDVV